MCKYSFDGRQIPSIIHIWLIDPHSPKQSPWRLPAVWTASTAHANCLGDWVSLTRILRDNSVIMSCCSYEVPAAHASQFIIY